MIQKSNKLIGKIIKKLFIFSSKHRTSLKFYLNDIKGGTFVSLGTPIIDKSSKSRFIFGNNLIIVNDPKSATLGKNNRCKFVIYDDALLDIGNKAGMSNTTIVATKRVIIGNNVMIGAGVTIVDSDFHSFNPLHWYSDLDKINMKSIPVFIGDNVFIGMDSIILKGVIVGQNAIIAAGSVVMKDIPSFEVWGGNPARFIRKNEM